MAFGSQLVSTSVTDIVAPPADGDTKKIRYMHVCNNSTSVTVYLKYDGSSTTLTSGNGFPLYPQQKMTFDNDGKVHAFLYGLQGITASGTADVRYQFEGA